MNKIDGFNIHKKVYFMQKRRISGNLIIKRARKHKIRKRVKLDFRVRKKKKFYDLFFLVGEKYFLEEF